MNRIRNCTDSTEFYVSLGWALIGVGGGAAVTLLGFPASVTFIDSAGKANAPAIITASLLGIAAIAGIVSGVVSLVFSRRHRKDREEIRTIIAEDMAAFSNRYGTTISTPQS